MKTFLKMIPVLLILGGAFFISACTHEDDPTTVIPPSSYDYGDDVIATSTDGYQFDQGHSGVRFETAYLGTGALFSGRFNNFGVDIEFDQDEPDKTSFSGWVELSSVNTGSAGRDQGCLLNTFDVAGSDTARFTSTVIDLDGEGGYTFVGDLTFHGITSSISGTLEYTGITHFDENSGVRDAPLNFVGFTVRFEFQAKSVFGIESGNIADRVVVIADGQFKDYL